VWIVWIRAGWGVALKSFFGEQQADGVAVAMSPAGASFAPPHASSAPSHTLTLSGTDAGARIAVYDSLAAAPRVEDVTGVDLADAIERLASRTYHLAREQGGEVPYTLIREIVENLVHAGFSEVVVTILDNGSTVRFSDQGPGIVDKERVFLPGFSTATSDMKRFIKGVGSGLPIVKECLTFAGGSIEIDDNLGRGTVVTIRVQRKPSPETGPAGGEHHQVPRLTNRQKQVLAIVMELGSAGPSAVAKELAVGLSTAYRDLASLEDTGLIVADETGKRQLTEFGVSYLDTIFTS
jgi:anti-sigma regulatory factor (Ser/Thr protein kinase)